MIPVYIPHNSSFNQLYGLYKNRARKKGLVFELTPEQFFRLTSERCYYCNIPPHILHRGHKTYASVYMYNGIDRKNNNLGYTIENSVSCCKRCNQAKNTMTVDEFKNWVRSVYKNLENIR